MKKIAQVIHPHGGHWVGDGFPVRTLFSYDGDAQGLSPFLLFDYAGPHVFAPALQPRGVGQHPHRGFETVTIVYDGEVSHRDSTGAGGTIGPGDVQWMTAAGGIIHEEFHSPGFTKTGGPFRVVQLWVDLPVEHKMTKPGYQSLTNAGIPVVELENGAGRARIIAGDFAGTKGAAKSFSPINVWDLRLKRDTDTSLELPEGHTAMIAVLTGHVTFNNQEGNGEGAGEASILRFEREGSKVTIHADSDAMLLALTGEPLNQPVYGYGPFVMTNQAEIRQAIDDFNNGRFGVVG